MTTKTIASQTGRLLAGALAAAALSAGLAGCQQRPGQGADGAELRAVQAALITGPTCTPGPTAHEKHIGTFSCDTCHPCGGQVGFDVATTFPRGTTTSGGTVVRSTSTTPANCTVACHYPMGAPAKTIAWNAPGPLLCTECHAVARLPAQHPAITDPAPSRAYCQSCHGTTGHMTGVLPSNVCGSCHGIPPAIQPSAAHPVYLFNAPCVGCHPGSTTVDGSGNNAILAGGQHANGSVEYTYGGHPVGWGVPGYGGGTGGLHSLQACMGCGAYPGYITMTQYYNECTQCHGAGGDFNTSGGTSRVSCGPCHARPFFATETSASCTFCH